MRTRQPDVPGEGAIFHWVGVVTPVLSRGELEEFWAAVRASPAPSRSMTRVADSWRSDRRVAARQALRFCARGSCCFLPAAREFSSPDEYSYTAQATAAAAISAEDLAMREILAALLGNVDGAGLHRWDLLVLHGLAQAGAAAPR